MSRRYQGEIIVEDEVSGDGTRITRVIDTGVPWSPKIEPRPRRKTARPGRFMYPLTGAQWEAMWEEQGGRCGICTRTLELVTDHDHGTGEVRGLLCSACNTGLGELGDRLEILRMAVAYLERFEADFDG